MGNKLSQQLIPTSPSNLFCSLHREMETNWEGGGGDLETSASCRGSEDWGRRANRGSGGGYQEMGRQRRRRRPRTKGGRRRWPGNGDGGGGHELRRMRRRQRPRSLDASPAARMRRVICVTGSGARPRPAVGPGGDAAGSARRRAGYGAVGGSRRPEGEGRTGLAGGLWDGGGAYPNSKFGIITIKLFQKMEPYCIPPSGTVQYRRAQTLKHW
jgi:hypothetical protein